MHSRGCGDVEELQCVDVGEGAGVAGMLLRSSGPTVGSGGCQGWGGASQESGGAAVKSCATFGIHRLCGCRIF